MRFKPAAILLALLLVFGAAWAEDIEEETYDPGDENEYGEDEGETESDETGDPTARNHHKSGAFSGGLYLGGMTWPRQDDDGDPYGNDAGGFLVGLRGQYYFIDNLAAFANLDFAFGDYTSMIRLVLGAQYNIPLSTQFTAFIGAGLAFDIASWDAFPYDDREPEDPEDRNSAFYDEGSRTNVGFNATGGVEFFVTPDISLRPAVGLDLSGSLHMVYGLGVSYYL
jgi:opacity protein-like surface antigen